MPYVIESIRNDDLTLRADRDQAVLCGVQRARVLVNGESVLDETPFCDHGENRQGRWLLTFAAPAPKRE
jgi:hypothetical protein